MTFLITLMAFAPSLFCLSRGLKLGVWMFYQKSKFFDEKYRFGVSEYSFVIPEVGMSVKMLIPSIIILNYFDGVKLWISSKMCLILKRCSRICMFFFFMIKHCGVLGMVLACKP